VCTHEGCTREATVLDHRVPFDAHVRASENPGKTCVENLYPTCSEHDRSKDEEGWVSVLGYVVGAIGALSALMGVLAMMGVAVTPFTFTPKTSEVAALPAPAPATVTSAG